MAYSENQRRTDAIEANTQALRDLQLDQWIREREAADREKARAAAAAAAEAARVLEFRGENLRAYEQRKAERELHSALRRRRFTFINERTPVFSEELEGFDHDALERQWEAHVVEQESLLRAEFRSAGVTRQSEQEWLDDAMLNNRPGEETWANTTA